MRSLAYMEWRVGNVGAAEKFPVCLQSLSNILYLCSLDVPYSHEPIQNPLVFVITIDIVG